MNRLSKNRILLLVTRNQRRRSGYVGKRGLLVRAITGDDDAIDGVGLQPDESNRSSGIIVEIISGDIEPIGVF